jgi:hypothetical protein
VPSPRTGISLLRRPDRDDEVAALTARLGDRVGLTTVLDHLDRRTRRARVRGRAVTEGFTWDDADRTNRRWWPQGITTSADDADASGAAGGSTRSELYAGRRVMLVSWYAKQDNGPNPGSRISVIDLDGGSYRHVLLLDVEESFGEVTPKALTVHAGGLAWFGGRVHVAATRRGLVVADLDDVLEVEPGPETFGYRFVLPVRSTYTSSIAGSIERMRYSFVAVGRDADGPLLSAGEYGVRDQTTRLLAFRIDPATGVLAADAEGRSTPSVVVPEGLGHMQGAVLRDDTWFVTTSRSSHLRGGLHHGRPGDFASVRRALPPGPEDLTYVAGEDRLWSLAEYPRKRWVYAIDRSRLR